MCSFVSLRNPLCVMCVHRFLRLLGVHNLQLYVHNSFARWFHLGKPRDLLSSAAWSNRYATW